MATNTLIPVGEYLGTSYRPDCDYVDGEVRERNLGEQEHSDLQLQLLKMLGTPESELHVLANPEIRVQVSETRFRVPDVCVRRATAPSERIIQSPPLLCIEILSPRDTVSGMRERVRDFLDMGVVQVWVFDTATRSVMIFSGSAMVEQREGELRVPETPIMLSMAEIFKGLDRYRLSAPVA
jgi:Uma2 family endonuclease